MSTEYFLSLFCHCLYLFIPKCIQGTLYFIFHIQPLIITLCMLGKKFSRQYFEIFYLLFLENRIWHFMQIVSREIANRWCTLNIKTYFLKKEKKKIKNQDLFSQKEKKNRISSVLQILLCTLRVNIPMTMFEGLQNTNMSHRHIRKSWKYKVK